MRPHTDSITDRRAWGTSLLQKQPGNNFWGRGPSFKESLQKARVQIQKGPLAYRKRNVRKEIRREKRIGDIAHFTECLPSKHEDLGSIPSTLQTRSWGTHL